MAWDDEPETPEQERTRKFKEYARWLQECGAATLSMEYAGRVYQELKVQTESQEHVGTATRDIPARLVECVLRREAGKTCSDLLTYDPAGYKLIEDFIRPHLPEGWDALDARGYINVDLADLSVTVDHKPGVTDVPDLPPMQGQWGP